MIEKALKHRLKTSPFLIMAHRGFWGGNIIENTIESAMLAYKAGADIVEVDVCRTADEHYYLFHDGNEPKLLSRDENFKELTSHEINHSSVYNSIGSPSGHKVNTLGQFLEWLPEGKLVNIDRSWEYWNDPEFFKLIHQSGKQNQLVFKSPVVKTYLDEFAKIGAGLSFIPIVHSTDEAYLVLTYSDIHTVGLELICSEFESEMLQGSWLKKVEEKGLLTVVNSENLGVEFNLLGGFHDDVALIENQSWDCLVDKGIHVIQTDWPNFLHTYRQKRR
ncbi:MAG: glycerophosphodiester phosphodiesterase family protein [Alkalibacterium sp.]|nr:glycerophosphodiester phosphodiesterase family protein [Alkalibacterium sp.]